MTTPALEETQEATELGEMDVLGEGVAASELVRHRNGSPRAPHEEEELHTRRRGGRFDYLGTREQALLAWQASPLVLKWGLLFAFVIPIAASVGAIPEVTAWKGHGSQALTRASDTVEIQENGVDLNMLGTGDGIWVPSFNYWDKGEGSAEPSRWEEIPEGGVQFWAHGYRGNTQICTKARFNFVTTPQSTSRFIFVPVSNQFCAFNTLLGPAISFSYATTHHSWAGSTVIVSGNTYYVRAVVDSSRKIAISVLARNNFDDKGGTVMRKQEATLTTDIMEQLKDMTMCFQFNDNYESGASNKGMGYFTNATVVSGPTPSPTSAIVQPTPTPSPTKTNLPTAFPTPAPTFPQTFHSTAHWDWLAIPAFLIVAGLVGLKYRRRIRIATGAYRRRLSAFWIAGPRRYRHLRERPPTQELREMHSNSDTSTEELGIPSSEVIPMESVPHEDRSLLAPTTEWTVSEVCDFLSTRLPFFTTHGYDSTFSILGIDGKALLQLTDSDLHEDAGITTRLHSARILEEIEKLKITEEEPV